MNSVGELIKERRGSKNWSKRALAERAGVSHSEVHRIETGEREHPSVLILNAIADALAVPKDDMLRAVGYRVEEADIPVIEKAFPDLKTPKQQDAARKIIDMLARSDDLHEDDLDGIVDQVEMFYEYAKKRKGSK